MSQTTTLQQSQGLKKLGFNDPVKQYHELFNSYDNFNDINWHIVPRDIENAILNDYNGREGYEDCFSAPQINDALEWCMKEYSVWGQPITNKIDWRSWEFLIQIKNDRFITSGIYNTFLEAQTACLDAVIEQCKKLKENETAKVQNSQA